MTFSAKFFSPDIFLDCPWSFLSQSCNYDKISSNAAASPSFSSLYLDRVSSCNKGVSKPLSNAYASYNADFYGMVKRLCSNKVEAFYQYFAFIFSMACSCTKPLLLANFSITESGTPPRVEANCVKNQFFIGVFCPTLPMNFWMPYLKLCCQVLYMTPSFPGSIVLPISKKSDFSRSPIGTKVRGVVVNLLSGCSVSISCISLIVPQLSSCVSSLLRPIMSVNAGTQ